MLTVADVMTREVLVLHAETSLRDAIRYLANQHVSGAPVGVISRSDVSRALATGRV